MAARRKPTPAAAITYEDIRARMEFLDAGRAAYLRGHGWECRSVDGRDRWRIAVPWGSASVKTVEADLVDAVQWQARHDGDA